MGKRCWGVKCCEVMMLLGYSAVKSAIWLGKVGADGVAACQPRALRSMAVTLSINN